MYGNPCYHIVINNGSDPPGHSFIREGPSGDVLGGFGREFEDGDLAYGDLVSSLDQFDRGIFWEVLDRYSYGWEEVGGI